MLIGILKDKLEQRLRKYAILVYKFESNNKKFTGPSLRYINDDLVVRVFDGGICLGHRRHVQCLSDKEFVEYENGIVFLDESATYLVTSYTGDKDRPDYRVIYYSDDITIPSLIRCLKKLKWCGHYGLPRIQYQ